MKVEEIQLRIAICDDQEVYREDILEHCKRLLQGENVIYSCFASGEELLDSGFQFDFLFLDIEMTGMDGIQVKNLLETQNAQAKIIFLTSHEERMIEAFGANVIGFLRKPVQEEMLLPIIRKMKLFTDRKTVEWEDNGRVYGLSVNGGSNEETRTKLNEVMTFYNNTLNDSNLSSVAQIVNGYSDYSESIVKADVARTWTFLRVGMGHTAKQASGVMGNIMHESGASPTNAQDSKISGAAKLRDTTYTYSATDNVAYGIIQWKHSDRKQGLLNMASTMESTVSDCNVQFAYLRSELDTTYKSALNKIKNNDNIENAATVFCAEVEITVWNDDRLEKANIVYGALA